jgi:hypothetical protein
MRYSFYSHIFLIDPASTRRIDAKLNTLKAMVDNTIAFFYPGESSSDTRAPQMLGSLPNRSREIILTNMWQSVSLTLGIMKPLYPWLT